MSTNIGATIKLDGEKQFRQALKDIDAGLKVNKTEMQKLTAEYGKNDTSVTGLTKKNENLKKQIASQTETVKKLQEALAVSTKEYGENDARTLKWQSSLNLAEANLIKMNKELEVNTETLGKAQASVEGLTEKNDILKRQIISQTEEIGKLQEGLAQSTKEYGENDARTLKWQESLAAAQMDLSKMNKELGTNNEALEKAQKNTKSLGDVISNMASYMGLQASPAVQNLSKKLDGVSASGAALVGVLGGIVAFLGKATISTAKYADDILTMSSKTGIAVEKLQELRYAAEFVDVPLGTMSSAMGKLTKTMSDARDGSDQARQAFRKLRVTFEDNNKQLKSSEEVFYATIDALGKIRNETERDALAMKVFGKSASELNPLIEAGSHKLKELGVEAQNMGIIMSGESLDKFLMLKDAMDKMKAQTEALKNSFAVALLPILTALFKTLSAIPVPVLQIVVVLATVISTIILAVKAIKEITATGSAIKNFFSNFNTEGKKTTLVIVGIVAALIALAAIIAVIMGKSDDLNKTISNVGNNVATMQNQVQDTQTRVPTYARGTNNHQGGWALVGEEGPELVRMPRHSQVYTSSQTRGMLGGGDTYYITIDAKNVREFNDVVDMAQRLKQTRRAGAVNG